jgi:hypothetical protein
MTSTECIAECPRDTHALRLSMAALVVAWLLPFSTALLGAGAFIAGVLMMALSILLRHYEGCAVGALLFVAVWRTALTARGAAGGKADVQAAP